MHSDEEENVSPNIIPKTDIKDGEKTVSAMYRMELSKGYFNSKNVQVVNGHCSPNGDSSTQPSKRILTKTNGSVLLPDTNNYSVEESSCTQLTKILPLPSDSSVIPQSNKHLIDDMSCTQQTYNAWKTQNRAMSEPQIKECGQNMVSNLGRSLEQLQKFIPNNPCRCDNSEFPAAYYKNSKTINADPTFENRPISVIPNLSRDLGHFSPDDCDCKRISEKHIQLQTSGNVCTPYRYMFKSPKQKQMLFSPKVNANHTVNSEPCGSSHYQVFNCKTHSNFHYPKNHCFNKDINAYDQSNFYNQTYMSNDERVDWPGEVHSKNKKSIKKEKLQSKQLSDLYRIVYLQNQQLGLLQKQVQALIDVNLKDEKRPNTQEGVTSLNKKYLKGMTEKRTFNLSVIKENENVEKVSVGIMTSFIENNFAKISAERELKISPKKISVLSSESESQSTSSDGEGPEHCGPINHRDDVNNISLTLNDVVVPNEDENVPSPEPSFHIEMQDYKSSSNTESDSVDSSDSDNDMKSHPPVGWTFYDTVVGKVNDLLKQSLEKRENKDSEGDVRNATIDHLRQLGVSFAEPESPITKRVTFNNKQGNTRSAHRQQLLFDSETSLHMNNLANKYLKKKKIHTNKNDDEEWQNQKCQNDLSLATLRYLERYQLSPNQVKKISDEQYQEKKKKKKSTKKLKEIEKVLPRQNKCGKILDITAIKKQPKLLPKNS